MELQNTVAYFSDYEFYYLQDNRSVHAAFSKAVVTASAATKGCEYRGHSYLTRIIWKFAALFVGFHIIVKYNFFSL